jgi:hypothetical protein
MSEGTRPTDNEDGNAAREQECRHATAFLLSEEAGAITGTFINVTSGMFPT